MSYCFINSVFENVLIHTDAEQHTVFLYSVYGIISFLSCYACVGVTAYDNLTFLIRYGVLFNKRDNAFIHCAGFLVVTVIRYLLVAHFILRLCECSSFRGSLTMLIIAYTLYKLCERPL